MWQQRRGDLLWTAARDAADPRIQDAAWLAQQATRLGAPADALQDVATRPAGDVKHDSLAHSVHCSN
jgi:hypothetical protein